MSELNPKALEAAQTAAAQKWQKWTGFREPLDGMEFFVRDAITAYLTQLSAEGYGVVPREATVGMFRALTHSWPDDIQKGVWALGSFAEDYQAMFDAAQERKP